MSSIPFYLAKLLFASSDMFSGLYLGNPIVYKETVLDKKCQLSLKLGNMLPPLESLSASKARRLFEFVFESFKAPEIGLGNIENRTIQTEANPHLPIRIYNAYPQREKQPIILYFHGGGFTVGSLESHDGVCRSLSYFTKSIVIACDYRLAPEHPYPSAHEDAYSLYSYAREFAYLLGGSPDNIGVAGDSAGALLAHSVTWNCIQKNESPPLFQALLYPVTDVSKESITYSELGEGFGLTRETLRWFTANYVPKLEDRTKAELSPVLLNKDQFKGFPPTYVSTAGFDPLLKEGEDYVQLLTKAGITVHHSHFPSLIHGYIQMTGLIPKAKDAESDFHSWIATFLSIRNLSV